MHFRFTPLRGEAESEKANRHVAGDIPTVAKFATATVAAKRSASSGIQPVR